MLQFFILCILFLPSFASNQLLVCKSVLGMFENDSRTEVNRNARGCPGRPGTIGPRGLPVS